MKKLLLIFFFTLAFSGNSSASMYKVEKIGLLVEYLNDRSCGVTRESLLISTKYILSNSKIEIGDEYYDPYLYIAPVVMEGNNENICTLALNVSLKKSYFLKDGSYNRGYFVYYHNNTIVLKSGKDRFKSYVTEALEEEIKKFIVAWNEDNK